MVKLKVDLKDLDSTTKNTLSFFFKANLCNFAELNSNNKNVDIFILDYDRTFDMQLLNKLAGNNQYAIMLHSTNIMPKIDNNRVQLLVKPIRANRLKNCINTIHSKYSNSHSKDDAVSTDKTNKTHLTPRINTIQKQEKEKLNSTNSKMENQQNFIKNLLEDYSDSANKANTTHIIPHNNNHKQEQKKEKLNNTNNVTKNQQDFIKKLSEDDGVSANKTIAAHLAPRINNNQEQEKLNNTDRKTKNQQNIIKNLTEVEIRTEIDKSTQNFNGLYKNQLNQNKEKERSNKHSIKPNSGSKKPEIKNTNGNSHLSMAMQDETDKDVLNRYKAHKHVGSNPDIDPNNSEQLEKIYHTPEKYLYFHLARAVKRANEKKSDIRIHTVFGSILFDYKTQLFHHAFTGTKLKYIKSSPLFNQTDCSFIEIKSEVLQSKKYNQNARKLIWDSAILASKGRVPRGTNLKQVIEMECWPNFTNLIIFRYVVQITSAWSRHSLSLVETAKQLEVPQRYVFTLYNAMQAIGCAKMSASKKQNFNLGKKGRSVFSKILSHIFSK